MLAAMYMCTLMMNAESCPMRELHAQAYLNDNWKILILVACSQTTEFKSPPKLTPLPIFIQLDVHMAIQKEIACACKVSGCINPVAILIV